MVKIFSIQFLIKNSPSPSSCNLASAFCSTRNGIPSGFLFRGMVPNGFPRVCFYFCSTERNSELFSLPRKGSERNSASMLLVLFHGTEFRVVFSSTEWFGTEYQEFLFRGTAGIRSEITICSVNSVFRGILFFGEIPNPTRLPPTLKIR